MNYPTNSSLEKAIDKHVPANGDFTLHFSSIVVGAIKNPLTNITFAVDLIETKLDDKNLTVYVNIIKQNALRISGMLNELLKFNEFTDARFESHSLDSLLEDVLRTVHYRISTRNIAITKKYEVGGRPLLFNYPQMKLALVNIIDNAIDAMPSGQGRLILTTALRNGKRSLIIEDNGCGIEEDNVDFILKPYFTTKPGGSGLGLATTATILAANRVKVAVKSKVGVGTRLKLTFSDNQPD